MLFAVTRYWLVTGLNLYVKELGSSRSPVRRLGDHFADPGLSGGFTSRVAGLLRPFAVAVCRCDG